ncbi:hypothetical protein SD80_011400 [Scytonema tolypothrichoides VB-61278]|nr:hypothetical protein SD80_011400 [Scytonema tolypothrichoides VB-61278]
MHPTYLNKYGKCIYRGDLCMGARLRVFLTREQDPIARTKKQADLDILELSAAGEIKPQPIVDAV